MSNNDAYAYKAWLESSLEELLSSLTISEEIRPWYRRSLMGGKKARPLALAWIYERLTGQSALGKKDCLHASWALEMIHAYSLIHDDLPAMDDDDFRRGLPSLHRVAGEAEAVLIGDGLLTSAFELLSINSNTQNLVPELSRAAGAGGMIYGQWLDIREKPSSLASAENIHRAKTGALFGAAAAMGAMLATEYRKLDSTEISRLREWGVQLGVLFQWVDDLLDDEVPDCFSGVGQLKQHCESLIDSLKNLQSGLWPVKESEAFYEGFLRRQS